MIKGKICEARDRGPTEEGSLIQRIRSMRNHHTINDRVGRAENLVRRVCEGQLDSGVLACQRGDARVRQSSPGKHTIARGMVVW